MDTDTGAVRACPQGRNGGVGRVNWRKWDICKTLDNKKIFLTTTKKGAWLWSPDLDLLIPLTLSVIALPVEQVQLPSRNRGRGEQMSWTAVLTVPGGEFGTEGNKRGVCVLNKGDPLFLLWRQALLGWLRPVISTLVTIRCKSLIFSPSLAPPVLSPGVHITHLASSPGRCAQRMQPKLQKIPTTSNWERTFFVWGKDPLLEPRERENRQMSWGGTQGPGDNEEFWRKRET